MTGALIIDLGKRHGGVGGALAHAAEALGHWVDEERLPAGGPGGGRWTKGSGPHPAVEAMHALRKDLKDVSNEDLHAADTHVGHLASAITEEKSRRGIMRSAAERIGHGANLDTLHQGTDAGMHERMKTRGSLRERLGSAASREEGHALLANMDRKGLLELAKEMNVPGASSLSKENLRREMVEGSVGRRLDSIATRGFEGERPGGAQGYARSLREREAEAGINPAKPLRAARVSRSKEVSPEVHAEIAAMVANPKPEHRARMKELLGGMTVAQIKEAVGRHTETVPGARAKADLINRSTEHLVGFKIDSDVIRHGKWNSSETVGLPHAHSPHSEKPGRQTYGGWEGSVSGPAGNIEPRQTGASDIRDAKAVSRRGMEAPNFDIVNREHRKTRINELTHRINDEANPEVRASLRKERADLAMWKEPGSRSRPREPFTYPGEKPESAMERHQAAGQAKLPGFQRDEARAQEAAGKIRALLSANSSNTHLSDEEVAKIVAEAKLNPRQMRMLSDEFDVELGSGAGGPALKTKAAKEAYFANAVAGAHRRNPSGKHYFR